MSWTWLAGLWLCCAEGKRVFWDLSVRRCFPWAGKPVLEELEHTGRQRGPILLAEVKHSFHFKAGILCMLPNWR